MLVKNWGALLSSVVLVFAVGAGCGSSSGNGGTSGSGGSGTGGSTSGPATNCLSRCQAVAQQCSQPSSQCSTICTQITEGQLECIESAGCSPSAALGCLQGGTGGSTGTGGTSPSGGSGGSGTCSSTPTCTADKSGVTSCQLRSGVPVTTTEKCTDGHCENGQCGYCSGPSECSPDRICHCADGTSVGVSVTVDCISGHCEMTGTLDCGTACADHGGPA